MATIYIDNRPYTAEEGSSLLHACLELGFDIPYFCWHPALHSVGACRQCAVKQFRDEKDTRGRIVMSCVTPVTKDMRISIADPEVRKYRAGIIELLMINHPHDCPVCDEGGECHLQDMTVMTGHVYRKFRFKKRTFQNQYLGPFVNHEMNRCIHCYRCIRFYCDYAGGRDLAAFASHNHVYFGRYEEGALQNAFSGNLAEVCPTGVFTDKTFKRHFTRTWDLQTAPSVCVHCGLGCNTIPGERYGMLRRIRNRYHGAVNGYFLCDRGRFGYEFVNHPRRIRQSFLGMRGNAQGGGDVSAAAPEDVSETLARLLGSGARLMGIGSPRASLEANYALRSLVGSDRFYAGMSGMESDLMAEAIHILRSGSARTASLSDVLLSDAVLILGEDVLNTAPLLALAIRQAVRNKPMDRASELGISAWDDTVVRIAMQQEKGPLFIAATAQTELDELAERTFRAAPDDLARLGFAVAHALDAESPPVNGLSAELRSFADVIARALKDARRPLVISGLSSGSKALLRAAANIAWALCSAGSDASLFLVAPECNSLGLGLLGAAGIDEAFAAAAREKVETLIIVENDLYRRADEDDVRAFLDGIANIIVIDSFHNRTTEHADVLLPAGTYAETTGTFVNNEGRAQQFFKVFTPEGREAESVRWLGTMLTCAGRAEGETWQTVSDIAYALADDREVFAPLKRMTPPDFLLGGQKLPRQPHRYSGRTAMRADKTIHEPKPPDDADSPLAFSMEGFAGTPPAALIARYWSPGWNSVQALAKFQPGGGPLQGGDPGQRLIEPAQAGKPLYFKQAPNAFAVAADSWLFVPCHHVFGSEELSSLATTIAERIPQAYVALNGADGIKLGFTEGEAAQIELNGRSFCLPVKFRPSLPPGVAGLPIGLFAPAWTPLPARGRVTRAGGRPEGEKIPLNPPLPKGEI